LNLLAGGPVSLALSSSEEEKGMARKRKLLKLLGPAAWAWLGNTDEGRITRAIMREDNELSIDLECGGYRYSVKLKRSKGDLFEGTWSCFFHGMTLSDSASGTLYASSDGYLLFGKWREEEYYYHWWAELEMVDHFADEGTPNEV
jgi:hypothetical protein